MPRKRYNAEATQPLQVNSMATQIGNLTWYRTIAGDFRIAPVGNDQIELRHYTTTNTTHYKTYTLDTRADAIAVIEVETKSARLKP